MTDGKGITTSRAGLAISPSRLVVLPLPSVIEATGTSRVVITAASITARCTLCLIFWPREQGSFACQVQGLGKGLQFAQTSAANENDVLMIGDLRCTPDTLAENTSSTQTVG